MRAYHFSPNYKTVAIIILFVIQIGIFSQDQTPVAKWGGLKVEGTQLKSQKGETVALKGMSLFDTTSYGQYANAKTMAWLRDDWKVSLYRAAMYTKNSGTFVGEVAYKGVVSAIDAAIETGLYIIVDWHILSDGDPRIYEDKASEFFNMISQKYRGVPNLIYEICNEPNGSEVTWQGAIKPYAQKIIPIIRSNDKNAIIIVGNPEWSSQPDIATKDPLKFDNILYTQHMYVASHPLGFIGGIDRTLDQGFGIFVTEWGTMENSGNSELSPVRARAFVNALKERNISWAAWQLGTKIEAASTLKPNASTEGNWDFGDLTDNGLLMRQLLREETAGPIFADNFESGNFKASGWTRNGTFLDKEIAHLGLASLRFEGQSSMKKTLASEGATKFEWSFYAKATNWKAGDQLIIEWSNDGKTWKKAWNSNSFRSDWQLVKGPFPREMGGTSVQIRIRSESTNSKAKLWLDDMIITADR